MKRNIAYYFFTIMLYELFLMGSGQLVHVIGGVTLRMLLFFMAMLFFIFLKKNINTKIVYLCALYFFVHFVGVIVGVLNYNSFDNIVLDLKPLMYFFCILPFCCIPDTLLKRVPYILISSSLILSILYLIYILLMKIGIGGFFLDFTSVYDNMTEESDFMFRGNEGELYYKGFVFLPIGAILAYFFVKRRKIKILIIATISLAVFFTQTRALLMLLIFGLFFSRFYTTRNKTLYLLLVAVIFFLVFSSVISYYSDTFSDRNYGDYERVVTFTQVFNNIENLSIIWGHGLGLGVPIRPVHMECAFLEIFHKQGMIGLMFWGYYLLLIFKTYSNLNALKRKCMFPFLISVLLIYVQSFFNPYLINPMGLGLVNLVFVLLLKHKENDFSLYCNL